MNWSKPNESTWKSGRFEIYEVSKIRGGKLYELCRGEVFRGEFDTLEGAKMQAAMDLYCARAS